MRLLDSAVVIQTEGIREFTFERTAGFGPVNFKSVFVSSFYLLYVKY